MPAAWIIIAVLFWIVSSASKIKKNQAAQAKQKDEKEKDRQKTAEQYARRQAQLKASPQPASQPAAPAMSHGDDWEDEEENWDQRDAQRMRPTLAPRPAQPAPVKCHETRPLEAHMHTPVMGVEGTGTEGEDCCHEFMLDHRPEEKPADFLPLQEETEALRAKSLLQGVIFSEVLGRRPVRRYGGRGSAAR
ncbi:MAG: hypothetical protein IJQ62_05735 [Clostridia bacterium]|nr:hypothetical protein [Clostridia bacterium]